MNPAPPVTTARTAVSYGQMFVSFEGLDGSGKTTQVERLRDSLEADGREVVTAREPGGTALGEQLRALVLHGREMTPWAEALVYAAARAELVGQVIEPALARGRRRAARPLLRQLRRLPGHRPRPGHARGARAQPARGPRLRPGPDVRARSRADPVARARRRQSGPDRARERDFHEKVAAGYEQLAALFPERVVMLDGDLAPDELAERILNDVRQLG